MTWNHRVMKDAKTGELIITEAYYDEDGKVVAWTDTDSKGHAPWGENLEEIRWVIEHMLKACDLPVLDEAEMLRELEESSQETG